MKIYQNKILILLLFTSKFLFAQTIGEGTSTFENELNTIEIKAFKKNIKKIIVTFLPDKEELTYEFPNDSIVVGQMKYRRTKEKFYGIIINGKIYKYNIENKTAAYSGYKKDFNSLNDSSGYKIEHDRYYTSNRTRYKLDSLSRIIESLTTYNGDTISYSSTQYMGDSLETTKGIEYKLYAGEYNENTKKYSNEILNTWTMRLKTDYFYDDEKKIIGIQKVRAYYENEELGETIKDKIKIKYILNK